jgi:hypothetical protein
MFCTFDLVAADTSNWNKVVEFSGSGTEGYLTEDFNCDYAEWRIVWNYSTFPENADSAVFSFFIYPGQGGLYISNISLTGASNTSGVSYVHNQTGTFYGAVNVENTASYDIIIEQDLDSIPELPPSMSLLVVSATIVLVFASQRRRKALRRTFAGQGRRNVWMTTNPSKWLIAAGTWVYSEVQHQARVFNGCESG